MIKPLQSIFSSAMLATALTASGAAYAEDTAAKDAKAESAVTQTVPQGEKKFVPLIESTILTDGKIKINTKTATILDTKEFLADGQDNKKAAPPDGTKPATTRTITTADSTSVVVEP